MEPREINRRSFLKIVVASGAMAVTLPFPSRAPAASPGVSPDWSVYVAINPDNTVDMISPVMEMGQFMRTTGPMILAEEMDLDWSLVRVSRETPVFLKRNADGELGYDHAPIGVGGSQSVRANWKYMRQAGATVRRMLIEEAAARWKVSPDSLSAENSFVTGGNGRRISYGELAESACARRVDPAHITLKEKSRYGIVGTNKGTVDIRDIVTGKPLFGIDEDYPDALQAVIDRGPQIGAEIVSYNKKAALAVPGVVDVIEIERSDGDHWPEGSTQIVAAGVAVLANDLWSAFKGRKALDTRWKNESEYAGQDSELQIRQFHELVAGSKQGEFTRNDGDVETALAQADIVVDQVYEKPLLAHTCMEPLNCVVDIRKDSATIVVGHQWPHAAAVEVEKITGVDATNVRILSRRMGGGFGRRGEVDYLREAILLGHKAKRPVKVTWTREDDAQRDFFGPAAVMRVRAGLKDNKVTGWHYRQAHTAGVAKGVCFPAEVVGNYRVENFPSFSRIPAGTWRGPLQLQWAFASESMIDELAHAVRQDPLAFRLELMKPHKAHPIDFWAAKTLDSGRMAKCYEVAAQMAQWQRKRPKGTGLGIAGHFTFGSYVAFVLEVSVDEQEKLTINRAWGAIDCGFAVNPNHVRAQMEGGFIDGLNAALFNKAIVKDSLVQTTNFDTLRWMKMKESPLAIEVEIIDSGFEPTGAGEPPTAPAAAALANAVFAACGKRIRRMPIAESLSI